jgi:hypothetical protein
MLAIILCLFGRVHAGRTSWLSLSDNLALRLQLVMSEKRKRSARSVRDRLFCALGLLLSHWRPNS